MNHGAYFALMQLARTIHDDRQREIEWAALHRRPDATPDPRPARWPFLRRFPVLRPRPAA